MGGQPSRSGSFGLVTDQVLPLCMVDGKPVSPQLSHSFKLSSLKDLCTDQTHQKQTIFFAPLLCKRDPKSTPMPVESRLFESL